MTLVLRNLNPRFEHAGTYILQEMSEVEEILFLNKGKVAVGFEINKKAYLVLKFPEVCVIGAWHCTFSQKANFLYKARTRVEGYGISKRAWQGILKDHFEVGRLIKHNIMVDYLTKIRAKVNLQKQKVLFSELKRPTGSETLYSKPKEK